MTVNVDDLLVIGAGWAGLFATYLATEQGAKVRLIAQGIGSVLVTPGWISVADQATGELSEGVRQVAAEDSAHPYALTGWETVHTALQAFQKMGDSLGLPYDGDLKHNLRLPTALGREQTPALAPRTYTLGHGQVNHTLYVGVAGWRDFYPALAGASHQYVQLPGDSGRWDASPVDLARRFDDPAVRAGVVAGIRHHLAQSKDVRAVGFPAILGLEDPLAVQSDLSQQLGLPIFEIPTLPPSVQGTRLFNRLRRYLLDHGARVQIGHPVIEGIVENGRAVGVKVASAGRVQSFKAGATLLATGGLYGGGLFSDDRGRVWEPLYKLNVNASADRETWFDPSMLATHGHAAQRFGIRVTPELIPINEAGDPVAKGLYAAGHLLAQPGISAPATYSEGIALATAYHAVTQALRGD